MIYRIDDVEVDPSRGCVRRNGEEIHLRPKTFEILLYLVANRDRLISREELLDRFWNGAAISDDVLAHSIAELRRTFGDKTRDSQYLKTVPKRGYRFVGPVQEVFPEFAIATEETTTIEVREEFSDDDSGRGISAELLALPPPQGGGRKRVALLAGAVVLCAASVLTAWTYWRRPVAPHEPQWWEVAWWKLDEGTGSKVTDSVHGLTATLPAGVSWASGISGSALLFTGHALLRGDDPQKALPAGTSPRTLMAWVRVSDLKGEPVTVLGTGDLQPDSPPGSTFSVMIHESGTAAFGTGHVLLTGKRRIDDDQWHQLAGVFEGGESRVARLFVDGDEEANAQFPFAANPNNASGWAIGTGPPARNVHVIVDDARIYERALRSDEVRSVSRCMAGSDDIQLGTGGSYYFAPIFGNHLDIVPRKSGEPSASVKNSSRDFSGVMFARREPGCGLRSIHGADMGQDLNIGVAVRVPADVSGAVTEAGPYFRSRRANPGDGIIGGTSAGYWVRLDSTGRVRVLSLYPFATVALSEPMNRFDSGAFHNLEVAVKAETLEVSLDGKLLSFDVAGARRTLLDIPAVWNTAAPKGLDGGSAGIAFSCIRNRGQAGGQEARNIHVTPYRALVRRSSLN